MNRSREESRFRRRGSIDTEQANIIIWLMSFAYLVCVVHAMPVIKVNMCSNCANVYTHTHVCICNGIRHMIVDET